MGLFQTFICTQQFARTIGELLNDVAVAVSCLPAGATRYECNAMAHVKT